ncbi:MAG TPA: hypothetical protein VGE09_03760 [Pseudoxanthomonas sp.]
MRERVASGRLARTAPASRIVVLVLATLLTFSAHAAQGKLGFTVDAKFDRKVLEADIKQVVVTQVAPGSPAQRAGKPVALVLVAE